MKDNIVPHNDLEWTTAELYVQNPMKASTKEWNHHRRDLGQETESLPMRL